MEWSGGGDIWQYYNGLMNLLIKFRKSGWVSDGVYLSQVKDLQYRISLRAEAFKRNKGRQEKEREDKKKEEQEEGKEEGVDELDVYPDVLGVRGQWEDNPGMRDRSMVDESFCVRLGRV